MVEEPIRNRTEGSSIINSNSNRHRNDITSNNGDRDINNLNNQNKQKQQRQQQQRNKRKSNTGQPPTTQTPEDTPPCLLAHLWHDVREREMDSPHSDSGQFHGLLGTRDVGHRLTKTKQAQRKSKQQTSAKGRVGVNSSDEWCKRRKPRSWNCCDYQLTLLQVAKRSPVGGGASRSPWKRDNAGKTCNHASSVKAIRSSRFHFVL